MINLGETIKFSKIMEGFIPNQIGVLQLKYLISNVTYVYFWQSKLKGAVFILKCL